MQLRCSTCDAVSYLHVMSFFPCRGRPGTIGRSLESVVIPVTPTAIPAEPCLYSGLILDNT